MAQIDVQMDDRAPIRHEIGAGVVTIGRDTDNSIIIAHASVSRHHAEIRSEDGVSTLRDLNSANGTNVNGEPVTETPLQTGDVIYFGTAKAIFAAGVPAVASKPAHETEVPGPLFTKPRILIGGIMLLAAALVAVAFSFHHLPSQDGRQTIEPLPRRAPSSVKPAPALEVPSPPEVVAVVPEQKAELDQKVHPEQKAEPGQTLKSTKEYWDQIQRIERLGNQRERDAPLSQYSRLADGRFDLERLDAADLESLRDHLTDRAQTAIQVARDLAALDPVNVDQDLLGYTKELCTQWEGAAGVDTAFADIIAVVAEQRLRFTTPGASALRAFDAAAGEKRLEREQQESQDRLIKMTFDWSAKREAQQVLTRKILARETETNLLLSQRYSTEFK